METRNRGNGDKNNIFKERWHPYKKNCSCSLLLFENDFHCCCLLENIDLI